MLRDISGIDFEHFVQWMLLNADNVCDRIWDYVMKDSEEVNGAAESANIEEAARCRAKCDLFFGEDDVESDRALHWIEMFES